jgi:hypothetical protein
VPHVILAFLRSSCTPDVPGLTVPTVLGQTDLCVGAGHPLPSILALISEARRPNLKSGLNAQGKCKE